MTLIVYSNGDLVADRKILVEQKDKGPFHSAKFINQQKLMTNADNTVAYVFNNNQLNDLVDPIISLIRRYELGLNVSKEMAFKVKGPLRALFLTRRHLYLIGKYEGTVTFNTIDEDVYISPDNRYFHYNYLRLTAVEIFETLAKTGDHVNSAQYDHVNQRSLNYIKRGK